MQRGMKWYKFLIYFALWAGAILNLLAGVIVMTGEHYNQDGSGMDLTAAVYEIYPKLKMVDLLYGGGLIVLAIFGIVTRYALAQYRAMAPMLLLVLYAGALVLEVAYPVVCTMSTDLLFRDLIDVVDFTSSIVTSCVMIGANVVYFRNRSDLFTQ